MDWPLILFMSIMMGLVLGVTIILLFVMLISSRVATILYRTEVLNIRKEIDDESYRID